MGLISMEEYIRNLNMLKSILEVNGIKLLIKPYQSENLDKYREMQFEILPWEPSCEVLFPLIRPVFTAGFFSTSMITGKVLYGIDSIDLSRIFNIDADTGYSNKYEMVFKYFSDYVYRAESFDDIKNKINLINENSRKK